MLRGLVFLCSGVCYFYAQGLIFLGFLFSVILPSTCISLEVSKDVNYGSPLFIPHFQLK